MFLPITIYNAAGEPGSYWYFYAFSIGLELLLLAFILRAAWTWPRPATTPASPVAGQGRKPLRTPQQA